MKPLFTYGPELLPLLRDYNTRGLVSLRKHDDLDVWVASYTPPVVFGRLWDDVTLQTRCMIVDEHGLVAKSFDKFFNVGEVPFEPGTYHLSEKIDGCLILAVDYNGVRLVTSKSTFNSDVAAEARKLIPQDFQPAAYGTTFELTHPDFQIVLDYGAHPRLTYLGDVIMPTQQYAQPTRDVPFYVPIENTVYFENAEQALEYAANFEDMEGFVLTSATQYKEGELIKNHKYKLKVPWYLSLHRTIMHHSERGMQEVAMSGGDLQLYLEKLPDYMRQVAAETINGYKQAYDELELYTDERFDELEGKATDRKDFALLVKNEPLSMQSLLFNKYNGKSNEKAYWKVVFGQGG